VRNYSKSIFKTILFTKCNNLYYLTDIDQISSLKLKCMHNQNQQYHCLLYKDVKKTETDTMDN